MIFNCRFLAGLSSALALGCGLLAGDALAEDVERVGHFTTTDGELGFVLDVSGETPRQRFDNSPEILVLSPVAAPRGDTIFKRASGEQVLRMNPYGMLTYFPPGDQMGVPMVRMGDATPLTQKMRSSAEVLGLGVLLEQQMQLNHKITVHVIMPGIEHLAQQKALNTLGDAVENTQLALERLAATTAGAASLQAVLTGITFDFGRSHDVDLEAGTLTVRCAPSLQLEGRPSSFEIEDKITEAMHEAASAKVAPVARAPAEKSGAQHSYDYHW